MNISSWLARMSQIEPERPALFHGRHMVADYASFAAQAGAVAAGLAARGVAPGDRVGVFMKNAPDYLIVLYGIWYAGAVAVPINAKLHAKEAAFILEDSGAVLCFASPDLAQGLRVAEAPGSRIEVGGAAYGDMVAQDPLDMVARRPDDLAWLFYTSGTTGRPKGVMITHRMLVSLSLCYPVDVDVVQPDDAILYAAPMSHGAGIYNMIHVRMGARHVIPASGGFDPTEILDLAQTHRNVQMFAAPTMVRRLTDVARAAGMPGTGLRAVVYAGGPMYRADILEAVEHFGAIFLQIYGQGECPMGITALGRHDVADRQHPRWRERLSSVGRAQSGVEVQIGDAAGRAVPPGQIGEIMVRGDTVMPGYWNNPEATAETLVDGWLRTGDVGVMDADGYVTMQDRSKDVIITGGSNVYPREVEELLLSHPDVHEASVVGRAHPDWGEEVVAFIVGPADPAALDDLCLRNIARFKRPKAYVFVSELPKNNYGKVLKTELRKRLSVL